MITCKFVKELEETKLAGLLSVDCGSRVCQVWMPSVTSQKYMLQSCAFYDTLCEN